MKLNKKLYLLVECDRYELPVAVADSLVQLAQMAGKSVLGLRTMKSRGQKSKGFWHGMQNRRGYNLKENKNANKN